MSISDEEDKGESTEEDSDVDESEIVGDAEEVSYDEISPSLKVGASAVLSKHVDYMTKVVVSI